MYDLLFFNKEILKMQRRDLTQFDSVIAEFDGYETYYDIEKALDHVLDYWGNFGCIHQMALLCLQMKQTFTGREMLQSLILPLFDILTINSENNLEEMKKFAETLQHGDPSSLISRYISAETRQIIKDNY